MNDDDQTYPRAIHESGHMVAAVKPGLPITGLPLDCASIRYPCTDAGRRRSATVSFAGPIAEAHYARLTSDQCRALWHDAWAGDLANIEEYALDAAERA